MARDTIVKVGIALNGKPAEDSLKALQISIDVTKEKIEQLQEKLYKKRKKIRQVVNARLFFFVVK